MFLRNRIKCEKVTTTTTHNRHISTRKAYLSRFRWAKNGSSICHGGLLNSLWAHRIIKRVHIGQNLQLDLHQQWWILHTNNLPCYNDDSLNKSRILRFSSKHSHELHIQVSSMSMYMDSYKAICLKDTCNTTCIFIRFYA